MGQEERRTSGANERLAFEYQPTLRGPLLHLRPLARDDFAALFAVASDPLIWEQHPDKSRGRLDGFRRFFDDAIVSGGALLVQRAEDGEVVGSSRYHGYNPAEREIEIGWTFLSRSCWGGVHNRELKRLMLDHAFRFVDRVVFVIAPTNLRSQRSVMKLGAVRDGSRPDASGAGSYVYRLTASDWSRESRR